jgi:hypothetical protein
MPIPRWGAECVKFGVRIPKGRATARNRLEMKKHLNFLSEKIGYKVLSLKEWCEERNINYSEYWDNKIVQAKYRNYILDIESKIEL